MTRLVHHRRARMRGRDPGEAHRTATPLELLFDLTFVVAFGIVADELAHYLAEDHIRTGLIGFAFGTFAITLAWINFSWFASAYDTDDLGLPTADHGPDGRSHRAGTGAARHLHASWYSASARG